MQSKAEAPDFEVSNGVVVFSGSWSSYCVGSFGSGDSRCVAVDAGFYRAGNARHRFFPCREDTTTKTVRSLVCDFRERWQIPKEPVCTIPPPFFVRGDRVQLNELYRAEFPRAKHDRHGPILRAAPPGDECVRVKWEELKTIMVINHYYLELETR